MIDDIAVSDAQNGMGYLLIRIVLHPVCHMSAYRTLNPFLIKGDIDIHSVLSAGDGEILNVLSFQIKELQQIIIGNERIRGIGFSDFFVSW